MKLYYSPGACSLAPHIALKEAGIAFDAVKVDLKTKKTEAGADYRAINAKGGVPAIEMDDGQILTEVAVVLQYIADRKPEAKLAPAHGTLARYRVLEWLNYIASEVHKGFGPLWNPQSSEETKSAAKAALGARFDHLSKALEGRKFLAGDGFTVADAYLFTILGWTEYTNIDLGKWPVLAAYVEHLGARAGVRAALLAEGLIK